MQCTKIWAFKSSYKKTSCRVSQIWWLFITRVKVASSRLCFPYLHKWYLWSFPFSYYFICNIINLHITTLVLMFFRQPSTLNCVKLTTCWDPTHFFLITTTLGVCYWILKNTIQPPYVTINHHIISHKDILKYLGVLLDNKLSWKTQVKKVKIHLSRACGVLSKHNTMCIESCL